MQDNFQDQLFTGATSNIVDDPCGVSDLDAFSSNKQYLEPLDLFKQQVGTTINNIGDMISIKDDELQSIKEKLCIVANDLDNVQYLNSTGYVLGYLLNMDMRDIVVNIIGTDILIDETVNLKVVVKYMKFWENMNKKIQFKPEFIERNKWDKNKIPENISKKEDNKPIRRRRRKKG